MATRDADVRSIEPTAARWWRATAVELASDDMWDVEFAEFLVEGAAMVGHHASGHAGDGYEPERAFRVDGRWWGGRPASGESGDTDHPSPCYLAVEFDADVVPAAITITHPDSPHVARRVAIESSRDGAAWLRVATVDIADVATPESRSVTVFYAPPDVPRSPRWRVVAEGAQHGFAWDVRRLRALRCGEEVRGDVESSGDAGAAFGAENVVHVGESFWGGRADRDGRLHLTFSAPADGDIEIDRLVIDQGADHWAESIIVEHETAGEWEEWRRAGGLRPGRNDVLLGVQPRRQHAASVEPVRRVEPKRFGPFDDRRILVLVAAYRDPEVGATVANALAQAAYPEHVRFAICHQYDDETRELLAPWSEDPRFRIDEVPHTESKGCCWARHRTFGAYDDEPYILQIDSHMRFAARWDVRYVDMLESIDAENPVLSSYPPRYTIADDGAVDYDTRSGPQRLYVDQVHPDLTTVSKTRPLSDPRHPEPSPTIAAGQLFARGSFCRDVVYDPDIYFSGEEISLAARAFTSGYDLFAPTQNLVWHLYQHDHPKHWEDHRGHSELHRVAAERLRTLFQGDHTTLGQFGLGSARTLAQFEAYADIRLGARRVTADGSVTVRIDRSVIAPRDDYAAFVVVFFDDVGGEVDRREVRAPDVLDLTRDTVAFSGVDHRAARYSVLPVTRAGTVGELAIRELSADTSSAAEGQR